MLRLVDAYGFQKTMLLRVDYAFALSVACLTAAVTYDSSSNPQ
jgi:hypothetical protein